MHINAYNCYVVLIIIIIIKGFTATGYNYTEYTYVQEINWSCAESWRQVLSTALNYNIKIY